MPRYHVVETYNGNGAILSTSSVPYTPDEEAKADDYDRLLAFLRQPPATVTLLELVQVVKALIRYQLGTYSSPP